MSEETVLLINKFTSTFELLLVINISCLTINGSQFGQYFCVNVYEMLVEHSGNRINRVMAFLPNIRYNNLTLSHATN